MIKTDYIIVGLGIAGLAFCEQLQKHGISFVVYDSDTSGSTEVSGGVFNPVVLKRFTAAWKAGEFLKEALPFYESLSVKLKESFVQMQPVFRILKNAEEQNDWTVAGDKIALAPFLTSKIVPNTFNAVNAPFGFGKVSVSGKIDTVQLLQKYKAYLLKNHQLITEAFQYDALRETQNSLQYKNRAAAKIVFTEGAAALHNPFFPKQLLIPNKGEYLIIEAPELQLDAILKGGMFIIPLGNHLYKVGATYSRDDVSATPTEAAKEEISSKLNQMIRCDFKIIKQVTGIRPTTKDRRPLLGTLSGDSNKAFLNGLGTRGILMAPLLAKMLYEYLEEGIPLPKELDIGRF
ncbi:glycine/D-amino acid oxidase-like deaminating enzyme [Ulvibacter sp. MAR_2010_11]|uniref:NAD(P)/FAD-dependent oxidoreductase n=1 Tax=Ulvibacter sp. MAR_2010_11 TaxID=1250229 RepID=UPI000CBC77CA|nr:FAD-binding oxidoreductase [Ulvibacter sp. MAR_2010_11]PKA82466.1 glycine/D-amino acid oxidase-like deaminating enzyme [Ulvibacter sp. MAR_2010_11]